MNGVKVRDKHVRVIVAPLVLNDRDNPLQSHSRVNILLREHFELTIRFSVRGGGWGRGGREREREREMNTVSHSRAYSNYDHADQFLIETFELMSPHYCPLSMVHACTHVRIICR